MHPPKILDTFIIPCLVYLHKKLRDALLDDAGILEEPTFIKMDVEGAELSALKGAKKLIAKNHPKLAICLYHKPEDIYDIPIFIKQLDSSYKLYIRHYSNYITETVLYAI